MNGIREAYDNFKKRVKATRGMYVVVPPYEEDVRAAQWMLPGADIFIPGPEEEEVLCVVREGKRQ